MTDNPAFTPGPWHLGHIEHHSVGQTIDVVDSLDPVAPSVIAAVECFEGNRADLHLIAAAPDLYDACERAYASLNTLLPSLDEVPEGAREAFDALYAAIALATPERPDSGAQPEEIMNDTFTVSVPLQRVVDALIEARAVIPPDGTWDIECSPVADEAMMLQALQLTFRGTAGDPFARRADEDVSEKYSRATPIGR